jgi:thiol-disulfide isomerase/thioredoxin
MRRRVGCALPLLAVLTAGLSAHGQQPPNPPEIVAQVRAAMATGGLIAGERTLNTYRAVHGTTPEVVDALVWLARGALSAQLFDKATEYADQGRDLALAALQTRPGNEQLQKSIGASLEVLALALVAQGARSDAVHLLRGGLDAYRATAAAEDLRKALDLLSLEGQRAPRLEPGVAIGSRSGIKELAGRPTLIFFWAHWCATCKAEGPMLEKLLNKYRPRGLAIVAPTRRYGYAEGGRPAAPDRELRYITRIRDDFYRFLKHEPVPVADANYRAFGVATIPMYVLTDRAGIVRLYHPGRITEAELEAAIVAVLDRD